MQLLAKKTTIKISKFSFELFMNFLQRSNIIATLAICNEYLHFDIQPQVQQQQQPVEALLVKDTGDEGARINKAVVHLGYLQGGLEDEPINRARERAGEVRPVWHCSLGRDTY